MSKPKRHTYEITGKPGHNWTGARTISRLIFRTAPDKSWEWMERICRALGGVRVERVRVK